MHPFDDKYMYSGGNGYYMSGPGRNPRSRVKPDRSKVRAARAARKKQRRRAR